MDVFFLFISSGENIGCPFATQEESGFEDELPAFSFLSFDPIMVAEQFTLMDAVSSFPFPVTSSQNAQTPQMTSSNVTKMFSLGGAAHQRS